MNPSRADILGRGWSFPFRFEKRGGSKGQNSISLTQAIEKVRMGLAILLGTKPGSRVIERNFGIDLRSAIFEPIDDVTYDRISFEIRSGVERFEPRLEILKVEFDGRFRPEGILEIRIAFKIISTQVEGNLVYPFYLTADTKVQGQITIG